MHPNFIDIFQLLKYKSGFLLMELFINFIVILKKRIKWMRSHFLRLICVT